MCGNIHISPKDLILCNLQGPQLYEIQLPSSPVQELAGPILFLEVAGKNYVYLHPCYNHCQLFAASHQALNLSTVVLFLDCSKGCLLITPSMLIIGAII